MKNYKSRLVNFENTFFKVKSQNCIEHIFGKAVVKI